VTVVDPESGDEVHLAYVVFEAAYGSGSIDVQESEVAGAAWFDDLPENCNDYVAPFAWRWSA
jgi:hypothetical protein